jgi:hypothetical protein
VLWGILSFFVISEAHASAIHSHSCLCTRLCTAYSLVTSQSHLSPRKEFINVACSQESCFLSLGYRMWFWRRLQARHRTQKHTPSAIELWRFLEPCFFHVCRRNHHFRKAATHAPDHSELWSRQFKNPFHRCVNGGPSDM